MATKGAIEIKKLEEERRHNLEEERRKDEELDEQIRKRGTDRMLGLGNIAAKMLGAAGKNAFTWYTYFFDMIMSQLKQSIDCYAGYTIPIAGRSINILENSYDDLQGADYKQNIVAFQFIPTIGADDNYGTTTAEASKNFNTKVRGSNSGSTNYDAIDLFKYPLAVDSPSYMLQWLYRGMALCNYKDVRDPSSTNYSLLLAHCYNNTNIMRCFLQRRAALVDLYNDIVLSLNVMNIPFNMPYILRHNWLASTVFTNNSGVARQYFIFNPKVYFVYHEASGDLKCQDVLKTVTFYGTTPDDILWGLREMFHNMLVPLTNSQAIGTMTGDINKAFGEGIKYPHLQLSELESFGVAFISDIEYLQSIKNADIVPVNAANNTGELVEFTIHEGIDANLDPFLYQGTFVGLNWEGPQLDGTAIASHCTSNEGTLETNQRIFINDDIAYIDYYDPDHISEEDQCYNLSFRNTYDMGVNYLRLHSSRSEIITSMTILQYNETMRVASPAIEVRTNILNIGFDVSNSLEDWLDNELANLVLSVSCGQFDFLPRLFILWPVVNTQKNRVQLIWNRNYNRNVVKRDLLMKIQRSALLSMFMPITNATNEDKPKSNSNKNKGKGKGHSSKGKNKEKGKGTVKDKGKENPATK